MNAALALRFSLLFLVTSAELQLIWNETILHIPRNELSLLQLRKEIDVKDDRLKCANSRVEVALSDGAIFTYSVDSSIRIFVNCDNRICKHFTEERIVFGRPRWSRTLRVDIEYSYALLKVTVDGVKLPNVDCNNIARLAAVRFFSESGCNYTRHSKALISPHIARSRLGIDVAPIIARKAAAHEEKRRQLTILGAKITRQPCRNLRSNPYWLSMGRKASDNGNIYIERLKHDDDLLQGMIAALYLILCCSFVWLQAQTTYMRAAAKKRYERRKNRPVTFMKITTPRMKDVQKYIEKSKVILRAAYRIPTEFVTEKNRQRLQQ
ncbi:hypothetical protein QR680_014719 [Steinernema hermaphroditum]|uniref:Uncharacterized protein n=1 Tax=Steinernema hermaphroditum TaxID=289476 RepID=A0AA39IBC8_9BILA|nr:hypothetical protein QR680_014719 [Steinernema hermaphroditum]